MEREVHLLYKNVRRATILDFLVRCKACEKKKGKKNRGLVVKPIVHSSMNSRGQLDLTDLQTNPDGEFHYILNYQDHLTKFVTLQPLRMKTAEEVAVVLLNIFTTFGAPCILHTDNDKEFKNKLVESLNEMWPRLLIVHGKSRNSQSQGRVERANCDIQDMLTWKSDNRTNNWS